jgi:mRNA interferase MazF
MRKNRPAMVTSPDDLNRHFATVIVAPPTSVIRNYPYRVNCRIKNKTRFESPSINPARQTNPV